MPFERPTNLLAGFIAVHPDPGVPELLMAGEQWAPQTKAIAEHSHGVWEFYYQVGGCSVWRVGRRVVRLAPSGLLVISPGLRHSLLASQESEQHYLFAALDLNQIAARIGSEVIQVYHPDHPQLVPNAGEARNAFQNLMRELTILRDWRSRALQLSVDALVIEVGRCLHGGGFRKMELHPAIHRAVGLMEQEPEQPWNTTALARRAGVSIPHLNALFQKYLRTAWNAQKSFYCAATCRSPRSLLSWVFVQGSTSRQHLGANSAARPANLRPKRGQEASSLLRSNFRFLQ